jgi:capsid protein
LKDWEHTIRVKREDFTRQFYKPYYDLWLDVQVLAGTISAPGYLGLMRTKSTAYEAYQFCRFTGENIPHIDPLKEVQAERAKLGDQNTPLTTFEAATEAVNGGDYSANAAQYKREKELAEKLGIIKEENQQGDGNNGEPE